MPYRLIVKLFITFAYYKLNYLLNPITEFSIKSVNFVNDTFFHISCNQSIIHKSFWTFLSGVSIFTKRSCFGFTWNLSVAIIHYVVNWYVYSEVTMKRVSKCAGTRELDTLFVEVVFQKYLYSFVVVQWLPTVFVSCLCCLEFSPFTRMICLFCLTRSNILQSFASYEFWIPWSFKMNSVDLYLLLQP